MVKIPTQDDNKFTTTYLLNKTSVESGKRSQRLGMATLGEPCFRAMWFKFRWVRTGTHIQRRIKRIFSTGDAFEKIAIADLISIGYVVTDQQKMVPGYGGHILGYIDGIVMNVIEAPKTPHLLEVKSMNDRNFQQVKKHGVEKAQNKHFYQTQSYMGKLDLTRTLYVAVNKNDSEVYVERIYFDQAKYKERMHRAIDVVSCEETPPNLFNNPKAKECMWCDFSPVCYDQLEYEKSCRTCSRVDIENDGKWSCSLLKKQLTYDEQVAGCNQYRRIK